ncbi:hypothetical protein O3P69_018538 [Scylla paramamosain]|uniref:Uncharacterized protein n=1 Tax=Scylla paramamosain TaxID=85552 RepID=A0AAW0T1V4_SCYPA
MDLDSDLLDFAGSTALRYALERGELGMAELLVEMIGADWDLGISNEMLARRHPECVELLQKCREKYSIKPNSEGGGETCIICWDEIEASAYSMRIPNTVFKSKCEKEMAQTQATATEAAASTSSAEIEPEATVATSDAATDNDASIEMHGVGNCLACKSVGGGTCVKIYVVLQQLYVGVLQLAGAAHERVRRDNSPLPQLELPPIASAHDAQTRGSTVVYKIEMRRVVNWYDLTDGRRDISELDLNGFIFYIHGPGAVLT